MKIQILIDDELVLEDELSEWSHETFEASLPHGFVTIAVDAYEKAHDV